MAAGRLNLHPIYPMDNSKNALKAMLILSLLILLLMTPSGSRADDRSILHFVSAFIRPAPAGGNQLVVSPGGSGSVCSAARPCALATAIARIRALNGSGGLSGDMTILLKGGIYSLGAPVQLTSADSGSNGYYVTYMSEPGQQAVLDGGVGITGWTLHDAGTGAYRARVPSSLRSRQLHVNGRRAVRARGLEDAVFTRADYGFSCSDSRLSVLTDPARAELVGFNEWRSFRCPVASLNGQAVHLREPCWGNASGSRQPDEGFNAVAWVENDYGLLDEPGEWYLDEANDWLYYIPLPGESIAIASVIATRTETLLIGTGSATAPIHNLRFVNLAFAHTGWNTPSGNDGYADLQAGFHFVGPGAALARTPSAVSFVGARNIEFANNRFLALGGAGLSISRASRYVTIAGNHFEDIASTALQIGDIDDAGATGEARNHHLTVRDNTILSPGAQYHDGVGIFAGYVRDSIISDNELHDLPYSGISLGWGWGTPSYAANNRISGNWIENVMHTLQDGGAVYTLGPQPGSSINNNFVCLQSGRNGTIYPDQGSSGFTIHHNVLSHSGHDWLFLWSADVSENQAWHNFTDNVSYLDAGTGNQVAETILVRGGQWPSEAQAIMAAAGVVKGQGSGRQSFCRRSPSALLVEDDPEVDESGGRWALAKAMHASGVPFANWDTSGGTIEPGLGALSPFAVVVWDAGQGDFYEAGPESGEALTDWLASGGRKLFLVSRTYHQQPLPSSLSRDYLGLGTPSLSWFSYDRVQAGGWFVGGNYPLSRNLETTPVTLSSGAQALLWAEGKAVGLGKVVGGSRSVYFGLPFDLLATDVDRAQIMDQILSW